MTPAAPAVAAPAAVDVRSVSRRFGATLAVDGVDLTLESGGIHALIGENGAGKSTLLGMLSGRVPPSSGSVHVHGVKLPAGDPRAARRLGIAAIYQELTILPALTAAENVVVGGPPSTVGILDGRATRAAYASLSARLGVAVAPTTRAGALAVAQQQQLEIMRALHADARLLLLDEPTAALGAAEREALLALMDQLRRDGVTMVFVSHNLDEVLRIADTVTVFRDGRLVETRCTSNWDKDALVAAMLGRSAAASDAEPEQRPARAGGPPALTVRRLAVPGRLHALDLKVHHGEILGIAGLVGAGRTTLLRALAGLEPSATGNIDIGGSGAGPLPSSPRQAWRRGIALVPENRKDDGLVLGQPAMLNATLADLGRAARWGLFSRQRTRAQALAAATPVGVAASALDKPAGALSGGNQQKLLLARCLHRQPRVLLADEPTRGVDVGAKEEILASLRVLAADGVAVLVVSSEIEEVLAIADRVVVIAGGRLVRDYDRCDGFDQSAVLHAAFDHAAAFDPQEVP